MIDRIINKFFNSIYILYAWLSAKYLSFVVKPSNNETSVKKILAIPFYPKHYAGGHERIGDWKTYIENENVQYDVHWTYDETFYKTNLLSKSVFKRYKFYFAVTKDRVRLAKTFHKYDAIWIQRAFIPIFPFKKGVFETHLKKHGNIIYDFYDADYESNYELVVDTIKSGQKITVASEFLLDFCKKFNANSFYIPFSFNYEKYEVKKYPDLNDIIIGWAGSPSNFENVKKIAPHLIKLENENENVKFLFICRDKTDLGLARVSQLSWEDDNFDYLSSLKKIDIGINPMLKDDNRTRAKVSFKCLEYMSMGLAFATSPHGIPKGLVHKENCLLVQNNDLWFDALNEMVKNKEALKNLGEKSRLLIEQNYSYKNNSLALIKILLPEKKELDARNNNK